MAGGLGLPRHPVTLLAVVQLIDDVFGLVRGLLCRVLHGVRRLLCLLLHLVVTTLERAAAYADKTVTDFVLDSALKSADALVRKHEVITLEAADWDVFYAALLNPPKPNAKLRKALAWYARVKRE